MVANRAVVAARRAVSTADAGVEIAGARPNPTLTLGASNMNLQKGIGGGPPKEKQLDRLLRIDQPIERGSKRDLRLAMAEAQQQAAGQDLADAERQQRLAVRQAYFDLKLAQEKAAATAESAALARAGLEKAELRLKAGDLSVADCARIRTDALRSEADARQAEVDLSRARLGLAVLLARERQAQGLVASDDWPAGVPVAPAQAALDERPDVAAAQARLRAAEEGVKLAQAQRTRDVSVGAQWELDPRDGRHLFSLGVSLPLFFGNDYRGDIAQAVVARDSVRDEWERVRAQAAAEVAQAHFEWRQADVRARRLAEDALPAARRAYAAVRLAFDHGAASALDWMDARRALLAAEVEAASARADAARARAALGAALNQIEMP